jgi:receptor protein-tyrosine kinase
LGVIPSARAASKNGFDYYSRSRVVLTVKTQKPKAKSPVELITSQKQPSVVSDAFRSTLASLLCIGANGDRPRIIALTSANPQEGKTTVACNLALAYVEIGRRVLLIDADMRRPRIHEIFKVVNAWGLSDLLEGRKPPEGSEAMVIETDHPGLYLLPAGSAPSSISNLLHSPKAMDVLMKARTEFDVVIIDTPPILHMPDARLVGRLADGVILVVRSAGTTKEAAASASQRLAADGTRVLGTVLNEWDPRKTSHGGYGYQLYNYQGTRPAAG